MNELGCRDNLVGADSDLTGMALLSRSSGTCNSDAQYPALQVSLVMLVRAATRTFRRKVSNVT